jgi:ABC-type Fe3+ transport system substrate-binding protein
VHPIVDGVAIPATLNKESKVGYAIGKLKTARNPANADVFLAYLATDAAQDIYAKCGFGKASDAEPKIKPLPDPGK